MFTGNFTVISITCDTKQFHHDKFYLESKFYYGTYRKYIVTINTKMYISSLKLIHKVNNS